MVPSRPILAALVAGASLLAGCASPPPPAASVASPRPAADAAAVRALAPTGRLRVGLYPGTPTSILGDAAAGTARGVGYDLGGELARKAGVPFEPVVFPKNAEVLAAGKAGTVDMVFTNATPARAADLDFSPAVLQVEQGYLVAAGSPIGSADAMDRAGVRVGVSEGSTSEATLSRQLKVAAVVRTASLQAAVDMLRTGALDAFATNKATLYEMADALPGSRVLPGRWGLETFAIGIPKGRSEARPLVDAFVAAAKADRSVARAVERAGLRGAIVPD